MGQLRSTGSCPFCGQGVNTPCFATYSDGYHCFTCGKKKNGVIRDFLKPLITSNKNLELPECTNNIRQFSPNVLEWLYKYYVYDDLIRKYNIMYAPFAEFGVFKGESLILPLIVNREIISYQRRFFPNKQFITKGDKTSPFTINRDNLQNIVLVEDYISAVRLGELTNVICLQGTHMNWICLKLLEKSTYNIKIWLDPDKPGQDASKEILNKLVGRITTYNKYNAFEVREMRTVDIMVTEKQPKEYSNQELKQLLGAL